ncbi:nitroreductase family protein [Kitasatospora sp. NBC_01287]|uniref:nitroreductase family protein n=1 Tax=Kitasatospora sp. NBC_01287 TaxID=2903573 RepID=UPI00224E47BF|nr:nitroreductase family protein [Kitasatospora sp. NBC_01287]MCX4744068.1 nitroreductase family protein [Kitasatospora sp. NBC_01287]
MTPHPFPLTLWSEAVYSRRSIPATLATGASAPGAAPGAAEADPVVLPAGLPGGRRFPLAAPPLRLRPVRRGRSAGPAGLADPAVLAALLHYSCGLIQHDLTPGGWPLHRAVASARCRYPSELSLVVPAPGGGHRAAAVYRFDPLHHQLALLQGAVGDEAATDPPGGAGSARFLVITSRFARTAQLYGDYAPRLCAQEAGMLLGAVHLVAAALGLRTRPGLDREILLALCDGWTPAGEHPMGYLELGDAPPTGSAPQAAVPGAPEARRPWIPPDAAAVLRARHSGAAIFDPEPVAAPRALLDDLGAALATAPSADFSCHLLVRQVAGTPAGHYVHTGDHWRPVRDGDPVPLLERIGQTEGRVSLNFRTVACVAYLAVRRGTALARSGADAFRQLHLSAGAAAHLVCVVAARHGLTARVHNGYDAATAERLLGLTVDEETVLFQVAIGAAKPAAGFRLPVVF